MSLDQNLIYLHNKIRLGYKKGSVSFVINLEHLLSNQSPLYNPFQNTIILLVLSIISILLMKIINLAIGMLFLILSLLLFKIILDLIVNKYFYNKVIVTLLKDYKSFNLLWGFGGIIMIIIFEKNSKAMLKAPNGNWIKFIQNNFPETFDE